MTLHDLKTYMARLVLPTLREDVLDLGYVKGRARGLQGRDGAPARIAWQGQDSRQVEGRSQTNQSCRSTI